jgi:hypothetical protein
MRRKERLPREERGPWYLITGLVLGIVLGVLVAWVVQPVTYTNTRPAALRADFKDQYRALIASAYLADGDLVRARDRLMLLEDADPYRALAEQAQRTLAEGTFPQEARALGLLAIALGQPPATANASPAAPQGSPPAATISPSAQISPTLTAGVVVTATIKTAVATLTPTRAASTLAPTVTPLPTRTATPTQGAPYIVEAQDLVCDPNIPEAQIQVVMLDAARQQVPGVELVVSWEGGENSFFTGLKPKQGLGYADFSMTPGVVYSLRLRNGGQPVPNLSASECENTDGSRYYGSWRITFIQP